MIRAMKNFFDFVGLMGACNPGSKSFPKCHGYENYIASILARPKHKAKIRARQVRDSRKK